MGRKSPIRKMDHQLSGSFSIELTLEPEVFYTYIPGARGSREEPPESADIEYAVGYLTSNRSFIDLTEYLTEDQKDLIISTIKEDVEDA